MKTNYEYNQNYLTRIKGVVDNHLSIYPRTFWVRFDLRYPAILRNIGNDFYDDAITGLYNSEPEVMKRFFPSLKAQIKHEEQQKIKQGKRVHCSGMSYVWVREFGDINNNEHYHVLILFNKDRYHTLGSYDYEGKNLANKIRKAWCSALSVDPLDFSSLVHFATKQSNYLIYNEIGFDFAYRNLLDMASYLAKEKTKRLEKGRRNFGASLAKKRHG